MKFRYFYSLSYTYIHYLAEEAMKAGKDHATLYFFTLKTNPEDVKVIEPTECYAYLTADKRLRLRYPNNPKEYSVLKAHSYYFECKFKTEQQFYDCVRQTKAYLDRVKLQIDHSLHALDKY